MKLQTFGSGSGLAKEIARRAAWRSVGLLRPLTLADVAHRAGRVRKDAEAVEVQRPLRAPGFDHPVWSFADVARFVSTAAGALVRSGVRPGSTVAICTENGIDQPLLTLAAIRCGAVAVPLNHRLKRAELQHVITDSGAATLVVDPGVFEATLAAGLPTGVHRLVVTGGFAAGVDLGADALRRVGVAAYRLSELLKGAAALDPALRPAAGQPCVVLYTSGTTGAPKGAVLTSESLLSGLRWLLTTGVLEGHSMVIGLPTAHVMGFGAFLFGLLSGVRLTHFERFGAAEVMQALDAGAEAFFGVPSMYQLLAEHRGHGRELDGVRVFASAADVMPAPLIDHFRKAGALYRFGPLRLPAVFFEIYGSVELSGAAMFRLALPLLGTEEAFVGLPLPGFSVRIRDADGRDVAANEPGELWVRGPGVFGGYHGDGSAKDIDDGWFNTGDLARRSRLGLVRFVGREKEVIKAGGYSVYPPEVQATLLRHPGVAKAAVIGLPHPTKGAEVAAVVVPSTGSELDSDEIVTWCSERLAGFKAPRRVFVVSAAEMPYGSTGKILKAELVARFGGQ